MIKKLIFTALSVCSIFFISPLVHAQLFSQGCDSYPFTQGMNVESIDGGTKIISTESAGVSFDDIDAINDARDEATLRAKAAISKFLSEGIKSEESISRAVNETKSMSGNQKQNLRQETVQRVKALANSSSALLRGVVPLGGCYTKGSQVMVSVGIKPETIKNAGDLANGIANGPNSQSVNTANSPQSNGGNGNSLSGVPSQPLQGINSYNNNTRLKNF